MGFLADERSRRGPGPMCPKLARALTLVAINFTSPLIVARCRSAIDTPTLFKRNTALHPATTLINGVDFLSPSTLAPAIRASCAAHQGPQRLVVWMVPVIPRRPHDHTRLHTTSALLRKDWLWRWVGPGEPL